MYFFFLKPQSNHLLLSATGETGTAFRDYYPVDKLINDAFSTTLSGYPHIKELAEKAKADGYVMAFGFSRVDNAQDNNATVNIRSAQPSLTVTATSENTSTLNENDTLHVTVKITPQPMTNLSSEESASITLDTSKCL